jgi:hypothetical protein
MEPIDLSTHILYWNLDVIGTEGAPVEISYGNDTSNSIIEPSAATQGEMIDLYNKGMWHLFTVSLK